MFSLYGWDVFLVDDQNQRMPLSVQRSVRKQNIKLLHNQILFSQECFAFIKRLVQSNVHQLVNLLQQQFQDQIAFTNVKYSSRSRFAWIEIDSL